MADLSRPVLRPLDGSPLFRRLSEAQTLEIVRSAQAKKMKKRELIFRQGDASQFTFVILSGTIKLSRIAPSGGQTLLRFLGPGEILAISTTVGAPQYPATAEAERAAEVLSWSGKTFESLILRHPQLGINALQVVSRRIREMQERFGELAAERVERRLARTLIRLSGQHGRKHPRGVMLDLEISRQDLGEMAGATVFSVSRILSAWEKRSFIKAGRQKILIREPHALFSIAEELRDSIGRE